jgi:Papain family cysteine protease
MTASNCFIENSYESILNSMMSPIKSQGKKCNAAHSMVVTAYYEYYARKNLKAKHVYSDQEEIDCDKSNDGCEGGNPFNVIRYMYKNGLSDVNKYKWVGKTQKCAKGSIPPLRKPSSYQLSRHQMSGDDEYLKYLVATYGPVASCISKLS